MSATALSERLRARQELATANQAAAERAAEGVLRAAIVAEADDRPDALSLDDVERAVLLLGLGTDAYENYVYALRRLVEFEREFSPSLLADQSREAGEFCRARFEQAAALRKQADELEQEARSRQSQHQRFADRARKAGRAAADDRRNLAEFGVEHPLVPTLEQLDAEPPPRSIGHEAIRQRRRERDAANHEKLLAGISKNKSLAPDVEPDPTPQPVGDEFHPFTGTDGDD